MWLASIQVLRSDIDDVTADGLRRVERQSEVFNHVVDAQLALVDGPLVNGARLRMVDHFTNNALMKTTEHSAYSTEHMMAENMYRLRYATVRIFSIVTLHDLGLKKHSLPSGKPMSLWPFVSNTVYLPDPELNRIKMDFVLKLAYKYYISSIKSPQRFISGKLFN